MFGIGPFELFLILLFGFLIFGPDKLPAMAKTLGKAIAKFRDAQEEMNKVIKTEVYDPNSDEPFKNPLDALAKVGEIGKDEKKQAPAASGKQESFSERKARYDKERAAKKAEEAKQATTAATATAAGTASCGGTGAPDGGLAGHHARVRAVTTGARSAGTGTAVTGGTRTRSAGTRATVARGSRTRPTGARTTGATRTGHALGGGVRVVARARALSVRARNRI